MGSSFENLKKQILDNSVSQDWQSAVGEWELIDTEEDECCGSECICGKENIRYLHRIRNEINKKELFPVGSSCIRKFDRTDLNEKISIKEKLFKLYHAVGNNKFLELSPELFSRKLIRYLYEKGAFASKDARFSEEETYSFFLKMFNKRDKESITTNQNKKIKAILLNNIKPFVQERLKNKIVH